MDPTQPTPNNPTNVSEDANFASELAHINQEMYKKNLQLAETNKTLSLLRKIDEIILSTVTDIQEVAQDVADIILSDIGFKEISILLLDKKENALVRLAISQVEAVKQLGFNYRENLKELKTSMEVDENLIIKAIKQRKMQVTSDLFLVLTPHFTREQAKEIQTALRIQDTLVYPLIVRNETIGGMRISMAEKAESMSEYKKDLVARLAGVIGIAIDNSLLYFELQEANERLKQLDKLKNEFVSLASHELRTPMTAIKSYLWMALSGKTGEIPEKQKHYLEQAYKSTGRLIDLVNDMLNVSRIESGKIALIFQEVDLNTLVNEVILEFNPRAQEVGVAILFTAVPALPTVEADLNKIKEVLINLIGNSLKFTPRDGKITISLQTTNGMVQITVSDTGIGLTADQIPKLFQKFTIVGDSYLNKQNTQGTGLGLYICKSLIEMHGGKIWVTSEGTNQGTSFYFTLRSFTKYSSMQKAPSSP